MIRSKNKLKPYPKGKTIIYCRNEQNRYVFYLTRYYLQSDPKVCSLEQFEELVSSDKWKEYDYLLLVDQEDTVRSWLEEHDLPGYDTGFVNIAAAR